MKNYEVKTTLLVLKKFGLNKFSQLFCPKIAVHKTYNMIIIKRICDF